MKNVNKREIFSKILAQEKSAFLIVQQRFEENLDLLYTAFNKYYPKVNIGYSYKTNYIPSICKAAHQKGCWAEVVSDMEVEMALHHLDDKSKIIYNGPAKSLVSIQQVIAAGGIINIDHPLDWEYIEETMHTSECSNIKAKVALRLNFSYDEHDSRFGIELSKIQQLRENIAANPRVELLGYHLHLPFRTLESYAYRVDAFIQVLETHPGKTVKYINIGGGFFGRISPELAKSLELSDVPEYTAYGKLIGQSLTKFLQKNKIQEWPELFIEPGSSVVADAVWFLTKIHTLKQIGDKNLIISYAGRHLLSPTNKSVRLPIEWYPFDEKNPKIETENRTYHIVGYTCIESDILGTIQLKTTPSSKDFIAISNVGSYSIVMGSDFIQPQPAIYLANTGKTYLVRERKNVHDILNSFKIKN
jgi:diaminopimelate decarboxylase